MVGEDRSQPEHCAEDCGVHETCAGLCLCVAWCHGGVCVCCVRCAVSDAVSASSPALLFERVADRFPFSAELVRFSACVQQSSCSWAQAEGRTRRRRRWEWRGREERWVFGCGRPCDPAAVPAVLGREGAPDSVHRQSSCLQLCYRGWYPQCKLCRRMRRFRRCSSGTC